MILSQSQTDRMSCPICGVHGMSVFAVNEIPVINCSTCLHRFAAIETNETHTRQTFDDAYFTDGDDGYTDYLSEKDDIVAIGKRYAKIMSQHIRPGSVLDVGAAAGFVMKGFKDAGWNVTGVEPNQGMATEAASSSGRDLTKLLLNPIAAFLIVPNSADSNPVANNSRSAATGLLETDLITSPRNCR